MTNILRALLATAGSVGAPSVEDVFAATIYTGTGASLSIVNNIDLDGEGGTVWSKRRGGAGQNKLYDSVRGIINAMETDNTGGNQSEATGITSFNSDGYTYGTDGNTNTVSRTYVSWTFREADDFFFQSTVVKASSTTKVVDLSSLTTLGMIAVKSTSTGSWYLWHKDLSSGKLLIWETDAAEATLGHITVSGTNLSLIDGVIADGTYLVYAWAHNVASFGASGSDTVCYCGTYTGNGLAAGPSITAPGFKPQYVQIKALTATGSFSVFDTARGIPAGNDPYLAPDTDAAEVTTLDALDLTANGFDIATDNALFNTDGIVYMYMVIREE